jgi:hypothetical protein
MPQLYHNEKQIANPILNSSSPEERRLSLERQPECRATLIAWQAGGR